MKILAIDDDDILLAFYIEFLGAAGHQVVTANNGREGLERLAEQPDLVLLDLSMPVMDGREFLAELDRSPAGSLPVIVLSAERDVSGVSLPPSRAFLPKPFHFTDLEQYVERFGRRTQ
jgi:CheY-like chemotaxis protein